MARQKDDSKAPSIWASRPYPFQEDMAFQRKDWRVERLGWVAMGVLVVLACIGLFSDGPLSSTTAQDSSQRLTVDYQRFYRFGASSDMRWKVEAAPGTETTIAVSEAFLTTFTLETITPEPARMVGIPGGMQLVFSREQGAPLNVALTLTPDDVGMAAPEVRLQEGEAIRLSTFIYP